MTMTTQNANRTATRAAARTTPLGNRDIHQMMLQSSVDGGRELLTNAAAMLRRYAEEIERYAARYDDCNSDPTLKHESVLSWAVNYLVHMNGNLRMDLMVMKAAEIAERRQSVAQTETEA